MLFTYTEILHVQAYDVYLLDKTPACTNRYQAYNVHFLDVTPACTTITLIRCSL
jgi:hypothetical protein